MDIDKKRHSLAHILAYAVQELYPGVKFGVGPAVDNGFYYDFELPQDITPSNLTEIEKKMKEIIKKNIVFKKKIILKNEAKKIFKNQPYKLELIKEKGKTKNNKLTIYHSENFTDLCNGPHVKSSQAINPGAFKLTKVAGAYWQGSEKNPMLTRIYGLAFNTEKELAAYLHQQQEAEKRDHRQLGQQLDLFIFDEEVGAGLPVWQPKGVVLNKIIEDYLYSSLTAQNYLWIKSPHIGKLDLWKTSGHFNLYRENMYSPIKIDKEEYMIKPMNCPFHVKVFQSKIRSHKDLPLKYAEFGTVYRYEKSGVLHGLTRVRGFTQDDAHVWCSQEQIAEETAKLVKDGLQILKTFGFKDYDIYLSTRPEKYAGSLKDWQKATNILKFILKDLKLNWQIDPGGGVFYGPKIDIKIKDSLGRPWQCTTVQVDFNLPERFNINYIDKKGRKKKVIMLHRALIGAFERFIGVLIEHYAGAFPLWLAPVQIQVQKLTDKHCPYSFLIKEKLTQAGFRVEVKDENETVAKKIRGGEMQKIPYLLVIGDKEVKNKTVRARQRSRGDIGEIKPEKFINQLKKELKE